MAFTNEHIVYKADATVYEINVALVDNPKSDYDYQYVVSLVNFGECFFETNLNFIAEAIVAKSKTLSYTDAINIQNGIANRISGVDKVEFDPSARRIVLG